MTEAESTTIVEWGANENGFNVSTDIMRGTFGKQWSIDGDDAGAKPRRDFCIPDFQCGSCALKSHVIAF
jgi:hypothetical protein